MDDTELTIRRADAADRREVDEFLAARHADRVARTGEMLDVTVLPRLVARRGRALAGALTFRIEGPDLEVATLHAAASWSGVGTALLAAVEAIATDAGCTRIWLVTTNDNVDALRFYQRRGFRLVRVDAGAVDRSRATLKPTIPIIGNHGIPIRDEIVLERRVGDEPGGGSTWSSAVRVDRVAQNRDRRTGVHDRNRR